MSTKPKLWKNPRVKKLKSWTARGGYKYMNSKDRYYVLTNVKTGTTRVYDSPKAAQDYGWVEA